MSDSWVGFRPSPKRDLTRPTATLSFSFSSPLPIAKALKLITTKDGAESWLVSFSKFDARLGAKLKFEFEQEVYGGTFARIDIPKRIILLTELHGEFDFAFTEKASGTDLVLNVTKTINEAERENWQRVVSASVERLEKVLLNA